MPELKRSDSWKDLERTTAKALGGVRVVRRTLFERAPDVLIEDCALLAECKLRQRFSHHRMIETAESKYCQGNETAILVTRERGKRPYVTLPIDKFAEILRHARLGGLTKC